VTDFFESAGVGGIGIWIDRRLNDYAPRLEESLAPGPVKEGQEPPPNEESLLNGLDHRLDEAVRLFNRNVANGPYHRGDRLLLRSFAFDPHRASANPVARRRALVGALLAAEIESQSEYRLHRAQNAALAACYETVGEQFGLLGCYAHAAFAYQRAAAVHLALQDHTARDRCALAEWRMKCRYREPGLVRAGMRLADLLCGYGYRPGRLMIAMVVQLAVFSGLLTLFTPDDFARSLHICLVNYLNPLGFGDVGRLPLPGTYLVVAECYAGDFSLTIFTVLLVRKWFRI